MDELLSMEGKRIPDGPKTPGRNKTVWEPNNKTKIIYEQHPYDANAADFHKGPHWHLDTPGGSHVRGDTYPANRYLGTEPHEEFDYERVRYD